MDKELKEAFLNPEWMDILSKDDLEEVDLNIELSEEQMSEFQEILNSEEG